MRFCIATVKSEQEKNVLTIRTTAFEKSALGPGSAELVEKAVPNADSRKHNLLRMN